MPDVTYDKKLELLYCRIKPKPEFPVHSVVMADSEHIIEYDKVNPLNVGKAIPAFSELTVVVDYDQDGDLAGVEILGLPAKKPA